MVRLLLIWALGGLLAGAARAQSPVYLPYYSKDTAQVYQLAVTHRDAVTSYLAVPKTGSSDYRDHYRRVVQEASTDLYNSVRYSALLDPVLEPYVQQVFGRILKANPQLPAVRLVLSRNPEPNARAVGISTVVLNLGLLPRLENESQLAFVLCHELAHVQARHMETGLHERLTVLHSKELRRQVKSIINSEYNISSQIKALALGFTLNATYHHRRYEKQADSLGYVLLGRTAYEAPQAYRALQLLDKMNEPDAAEPLALPTYLSCAAFPQTFATAPAKSASIFNVQKVETVLETTDTLKTHPDCAKRMGFLRTLAQGRVAEGPQPSPTPEFARIQQLSRFEIVQSWFDYDCYDHALYEALQLLPQQPQNTYLHSIIVLSLYELRQHLQNHTFTEVVSNISPRNAPQFNDLLYALHGLHYDDFKGLTACFAEAVGPLPATDEYAVAARYAASALGQQPETAAALKAQYQSQFAKGKFDQLLFPAPKAPAKRR